MASTEATKFLTKQLHIQKETVTFRWLSRALSVHVNVAKNELALFYASSQATDEPVHATYILIGDLPSVKAAGNHHENADDMDVDDGIFENVATRKIVLVGEDNLEATKVKFTRAPSVHIYSLSPSAIRDAALLTLIADRVRSEDASKGKAYNQTIGIIVGPDVKIGHSSKLARAQPSGPSKPISPALVKEVADKPNDSGKGKPPESTKLGEKQKGTLDWSKAKAKIDRGKETTAVKKGKEVIGQESKVTLRERGGNSKSQVKKEETTKANVKKESAESKIDGGKARGSDVFKRGVKRPSGVLSLSDSEDDKPSPKTKSRVSTSPFAPSQVKGVKVKRGVLLSDDEEEESAKVVKAKRNRKGGKSKGQALVSDDEDEVGPSVRAMMDLDDPEVTCHGRVSSPTHQSNDEDVEMLSESESIPERPRAKRKPKKVVPTGKNGVPKRKVLKSRKSKNAKGYTITEDYSSYESVSESEQVRAPLDTKKKPKGGKNPKKDKGIISVSASNAGDVLKPGVSIKSKDTNDMTTMEADPEAKKTESSFNGESKLPPAKSNNGGKNNLMSYFKKK